MYTSPSFRWRTPDDTSDSSKNVVVPDRALPYILLHSSHDVGASNPNWSTRSMAGEDPTARHPAMHLSTITPPHQVRPDKMLTPEPNARYIHVHALSTSIWNKNIMAALWGVCVYNRYQDEQVRENFIPKAIWFLLQMRKAMGFISNMQEKPGLELRNTRTRRCHACMLALGKVLVHFTRKARSANVQRCRRGLATRLWSRSRWKENNGFIRM